MKKICPTGGPVVKVPVDLSLGEKALTVSVSVLPAGRRTRATQGLLQVHACTTRRALTSLSVSVSIISLGDPQAVGRLH